VPDITALIKDLIKSTDEDVISLLGYSSTWLYEVQLLETEINNSHTFGPGKVQRKRAIGNFLVTEPWRPIHNSYPTLSVSIIAMKSPKKTSLSC